MSSVPARYEVSGERRKPKPSGSTSSVPSPKMLSPFLARFLSRAKISSCLRRRLAPSISLAMAISRSWVTWRGLSSDRCMAEDGATAERGVGGRKELETGVGLSPYWAPPEDFGGRCGRGASVSERTVLASEIAVNKRRQLRFGQRADLRRLDIAVLEQHQRGNAADAEFGRRLLVFVDVQLGDLEPAGVFLGHVIEDGRNHLARTAPLGPVIDKNRGSGLQHFRFEIGVGDVVNMLAHW